MGDKNKKKRKKRVGLITCGMNTCGVRVSTPGILVATSQSPRSRKRRRTGREERERRTRGERIGKEGEARQWEETALSSNLCLREV